MAQEVSFGRLIAAYLVGVPAASRRQYRDTLDGWAAWCADNAIDTLRPSRWHIEAYGEWLRRMGKRPATIANAYVPICALYRYAHQEGLTPDDPGRDVRRPHVRKWSQGTWLEPDEAGRLTRLAARDPRPWLEASVRLMLTHGLRVGELIAIDVTDLTTVGTAHAVRIHRKADWQQTVVLTDATWRAVLKAKGRKDHGPLIRIHGRRATEAALLNAVSSLAVDAGVDPSRRITPHSLRRTFATLARQAGVPDREIMASAGWTRRSMIDYYDMGRLSCTSSAAQGVEDIIEP